MTSSAATPPPESRTSRRKQILSFLGFGAIAVIGVLIVLYAWKLPPFSSPIESTDNAQVRGLVTIISPQLSGYVAEVHVQDFQRVHAGELLVKIDDRIYQQRADQARAQLETQKAALSNSIQQRNKAEAAIRQAQATLANARAQALKADADLRRVEDLVADGSLSLRERDQTRAAHAAAQAAVAQGNAALETARQDLRSVVVNRDSLEAAVSSAQAALRLAEIDLSNTRILAPRDGKLGQVTVRQGAYVNAGTQLTALVPDRLWVVANMKETQMAHVRLGQPATFRVDALNGAELKGHVERISPATGSEFAVLPPDNATGNFVKIAQRIPVRISIDPDQPLMERLSPGMSVEVSIDTSAPGQAAPAAQEQKP
ncbi:HlyD family secretion protein [Noviherbaspirillum massiliense]|uniref:HlyD family secretion protein n=1 Tax=Noviherbaspirillum massiliense TaxID=1465823 RepID=UPI00031E18EE|nr:HlyD family secretion protein [Noviherbaspirillum massiliense]